MVIDEEQFKKAILDSGLITRSELEAEAKKAETKNQKLGNILLSDGKISETDLKRMEAFVLEIPFVSLVKEKLIFLFFLLSLNRLPEITILLLIKKVKLVWKWPCWMWMICR